MSSNSPMLGSGQFTRADMDRNNGDIADWSAKGSSTERLAAHNGIHNRRAVNCPDSNGRTKVGWQDPSASL